MPWLIAPDACAAGDALVTSLTSRAAMQKRTLRPTADQAAVARQEGWIHLPSALPTP